MAGKPWEKYQTQTETAGDGPWSKYQTAETKKEEPGMFARALEKVDQYSGAPVREFVGALQDKKSIYDSAKDAYHQIGKPTKDAPTPQDIVNKDRFLGKIVNSEAFQKSFADTPMTWGPRALLSPAVGGWDKAGELVGKAPKAAAIVGVGAATDPIAHVPVTPFVKPAQKAYGLLPEAIKSPLKTGGNIVASGAEYLTGVPKAAWKNYIENPQAIKALEEAHGPNVADAADSLRESWGAAIGQKKQTLGQIIDEALSAAPKKAKIDPAEIIGPLNEAKKNLNPNIKEHAAAIAQIDDHINQVRALAPEGKLTAKDAYDLQKTMQGRGRASYAKDGSMFNPAPESAKAARGAAAETRKIVNGLLPDIAKANEALSELHGIEETMRPGLYKPGASNVGLMSTLSKTQTPEAQQLEALGRWIDRDVVQEAKDFATYKRFQGMGNDASDQTGKAVYRMLGGSILGGAAGGTSGDPMNALIGAGAGALSTNPRRIRNLIDAALAVKNKGAGTFGKGGLLDKGAEQVRPFLTALERRINPTLEKGVKTAEDFILDEAGQFTPGQIKGFLKREGTYDLKKAREAAGPAKGLLPGEGGAPVAKYRPPLSKEERADLLNWIDSAYNTLRRGERFSPVDEKYLREVLPVAPDYQKKYVKDLLEQIEKQKTGLNTGEQIIADRAKSAGASSQFKPGQKITAEDGRDFEIINVNPETGLIMMKTPDGGTSFDYADNIASFLDEMKQEPRGLLTNLNVERGPVRELPEAGKLVDTVRENVGDQWVAGKRIGGIHKAELGPRAGKEFTLTGKTKEGSEASGWDALHEIKFKDGKSDWVTSNEVFHMTDPDSYRNPYVPSVKVGKYEVGPRNVAVDKNGNSWRIKSIDPKSGTVNLTLEKQAGGMREANLPGEKTVSVDEIKNWRTAGEHSSFVYQGDKAAQQAAEAKKVVSVDVPGAPKRGRAPETKPEMAYKPRVVPSDLKYKIGEDVLYGGRPAKIVQYNGNGVYTIKRGNSHDQVHMVDLKPKSKPTRVDVPFGGKVTLKKAQTNSAYNSNPKFEVAEALDDGSGYLVFDPENNRTFEVKHEDISGVFNNKGKPVKPKGKK